MSALLALFHRLKTSVKSLLASGETGVFYGAYLLLLIVYLAPLWVTAPLFPGLDLPFHLSMADMLSKSGDPHSPYSPYYQAVPALAPYAAHYLALWAMSKVMTILTAHQVLTVLYVGGTPLAMASLLNALGRSRLPALLAFPLVYNLPLHYGFISYAFSLPVVVWSLAEVARLLQAPAPITRRWLITAAAALLLFLSHLQNFAYGVCAALAFVLFSGVPWRRRLVAMTAFLPSVAALAWWQLTLREDPAHKQRRGLAFAWRALKAAREHDLPRGPDRWMIDLKSRLVGLPNNALRAFADQSEVEACHALVLLVAIYFCVGVVGRFGLKGPANQRPPMRVSAWVAFLGALTAYVVLPHHLNEFDIVTFFPRFAPLVLLMALPVIPRGLSHFTGWLRLLIVVPALILCVGWGVRLTRHYQSYAAETVDFRAVMAAAKPGYRMVGMPFDRWSRVLRIESAMLGMANYYPLLKPSPKSMVPLLYCDMLHMPCVQRPLPDGMPSTSPWLPDRLDPDRGVAFFDYFLMRAPPPNRNFFGKHQNEVVLVIHRGQWWLYKKKTVP